MACTVTLANITYGCDDLGIGGIVELHVASRAAALAAITTKDDSTRVVSVVSGAASDVLILFQLERMDSLYSQKLKLSTLTELFLLFQLSRQNFQRWMLLVSLL